MAVYNVKEYHKNKIEEIKNKVTSLGVEEPCVMIIYDTGSSDSNMYYRMIKKDCEAIGVKTITVSPKDYNESRRSNRITTWLETMKRLPIIHVVNQFATPDDNNVFIPLGSDVEGISKDNSFFTPACGRGLIEFLEYNKIPIDGELVTIVGRGKTMGNPLRVAFSKANATLVICNSHTDKELINELVKISKILITAADKPEIFDKSLVKNNRSLIVVDAATCFDENGKLCGNCKPEIYETVRSIGVPGGMGLLNRIGLMENIVDAIENFRDSEI